MLLFIAFVCLVLGLGVPTTANYVLVATLMAPVVVELGAQAGLVIPLIAVHLFVFYYGIMGDITPPVGLATFAAAAISGEDAIATGIQGAVYALRTVILPFIWIFNPALLLIDIDSIVELVIVVVASTLAMLVFAAITMYWFRVPMQGVGGGACSRSPCLLLFRPDMFMDQLAPEYAHLPAAKLYDVARDLPGGRAARDGDQGPDDRGRRRAEDRRGAPRARRATTAASGSPTRASRSRDSATRSRSAASSSARARGRPGIDQGYDVARVEVPSGRPSPYWFYLPALAADRARLVVAGAAHGARGAEPMPAHGVSARCRAASR